MPNKRKGEEYPAKSGILITPKTNPSGSKAYRVDIPATITGAAREQRQFQLKEEARTYAAKRHDEITRFGHAAFTLTAAQRNDATRALGMLAPFGISLSDAVAIAMKHLPKSTKAVTLTELRALFLAAPGKRKAKLTKRRPLTVHNLSWRTKRLQKAFGSRQADSITTSELKHWLGSLGELSPVSLNNYRRVLHALFAFGVAEGYCPANPVTAIPLHHVPDRNPAILTTEQAERLVRKAAETDEKLGLLGYVVLGLFSGLRRAELERLDWSAVKWERRMVTVDGSIAKTGSIRNVVIPPNALDWLAGHREKAGAVIPPNLTQRFRRLRKLAGITVWDGNELRHSFASYHFDLHQNAALTAALLGHHSGTQLLFEHYRSLVPLGAGERFFGIKPEQRDAADYQTPVRSTA